MNTNDKPAIVARDAAQAAAAAEKVAAAINALPPSATRNNVLKVLAGVGWAAGVVITATTAGIPMAIIGGVPSLVGLISAWMHPTPQAVAAFGAAAK